MRLYIRSQRNGRMVLSSYEGMTETTVRTLMADLGHTEIEVVSESAYNEAAVASE